MVASAPPPSLYDALAPVYDRWQRSGGMTPFSELVLRKLLPVLGHHTRGPARSFVDLGCGTGDLLLRLHRERPGWRLAGADGSAGMLAVARGKPGAARVEWVQTPLDAPRLPAPVFDAAGSFYDTLNHLPDAAGLRAACRGIAAGLAPGGLFVFDATNEEGFACWWSSHRVWRGPDWSVAVVTRYDPDQRLGHAETVIDDHGRRAAGSLTERCFSDGEVEEALASAGLDLISREPWSPFDTDVPGKTWWISTKST
ncbi:MAG TPA: class I SAM-dependent methyltransferase [Polyangia bacterium]|jgi:SAM-dependent methyltransferase|nr:class I SAM-dependent methyltransferase [Polyangia bacterium]